MQHYVFAVHAFVNTVKKFDSERFVYSIHETRTDEVLKNVKNLKSEIGIIAYSILSGLENIRAALNKNAIWKAAILPDMEI